MQAKKIAVLGGGHGAHMMAADMALKGHCVNMYEMPEYKEKMAKVFQTKEIQVVGDLKATAVLNDVTDDIEKAISGADYILMVTPAFAHEDYARLLKGKVKKNQILVTFPGAFAALVIRHIFDGEECPILADVNNLPYDTRLMAPGVSSLFGRNKVNIAFFPASAGDGLIEQLREDLFPFERVYSDVLECGLSIVNPAWHSGPCLFNISNIERPDVNFFVYEHGWTPSAAKLDIVLDNERKAIGNQLGYNLHPMEDFSGMPVNDYTWQQLYAAGHGAISLTPICGPNSIYDRYLTEDAPFGLVPWASIAELLGIQTPITNAVIDIYNIIHETDWRREGCTAENLGIAGMSKETLMKYVKTGEA